MIEIEHLLYKVKKVIVKASIEKEARRKRGELFNIFDVLGVSSSEVRTHTAFLAELLNPNGSHGLGSFPLQSFISIINSSIPFEFDSKSVQIRKEKSIGIIDTNYDNGGQIDILIESGRSAIIIENKIYAGDQRKQLLRYYRYAKSHYEDFVLLYLSLDKHSPSDSSITIDKDKKLEDGIDFFRISYKDHIVTLLDKCIREAFDKPIIRETLVQYKNLTLILTHSDMDNKSKEDLIKVMFEHPESVSEIINYRDEYLNQAVTEHFIPQLNNIAEKYHLEMGPTENFLSKTRYCGINFWKTEWQQLMIRLEFDDPNWKDMFVGVCWNDYTRKKGGTPFSCLEGSNHLWVGGWKYLNPRFIDYSVVPTILAGDEGGGYYEQIDNLFKLIIQESMLHDM